MHYILGTIFKIEHQQKLVRSRYERQLTPGLSYSLIHISAKQDNTRDYIFAGSDKKVYTINFPSCREADNFIANCRKEVIPNYEQKETADDL